MAGKWWIVPLTGGLAVLGCAGNSSPRSDTLSAQGQAQQQLQQAADAQQQAAEEQRRSEEANKALADAQRGLADAQARAEGQREKARASQERATQLTQSANQVAAASQQAAALAQQRAQQSTQLATQQRDTWRDVQEVSGQIIQASGNRIQMRDSQQHDLTIELSDATAVRVNGRYGSTAQVRPGDDVRASFQTVDGRRTAVRLDIQSRQDNGSPSPIPGEQPLNVPADANPPPR